MGVAMEIGFANVARAQPVRLDVAAPRPGSEPARDSQRVPEAARSGLPTPFGTGREEVGALRSQLAADAAAKAAQPDATQADTAKANSAQADESNGPQELSEEEQAVVDQLAARDREVRNHEEAHARVGGQYAGNPSYTFQEGPDGKQYAIGGEVPIDVSPVPDDPEATITKMEVVKAAALAPAEPSGQDRRVAALADAQRQQAIADLAELRRQTEPLSQPTVDIAA